jgi:putative transposase
MYLTEKHIIKRTHPFYNECDKLCFQSKNIYNQGLYNVRQHYFNTKKYLNYYGNYHLTKTQECYDYLPTRVFCQTLKHVDMVFKSFFALLKNKTVKNSLPKYLDKVNGRYVATFIKQAIGLGQFKKTGKLHLSQTDVYISTKLTDFSSLKEVRIVPRIHHYVIEVVYQVKEKTHCDNGKYAAIDLGLNNLATVAFNDGSKPLIVNGRPIKSINQYYNKKKAQYQSRLKGNKRRSQTICTLTNKRNNKVTDYLHKASRLLVNQLVSQGITTLVIGKNKNMKQDINIGKVNNQNFVQLPIMRFADLMKYKCELEGIKVLFNEESYTSKCSFLDGEPICKHDKYMGKRVKRGLFVSQNGIKINADVNAAYNILIKAIPNAFADGIEGVVVHPLVLTIKK